jgi:hypothetical protein
MHKLRINISDKPKLRINSPEVCFDIKRQHAQVGNKNINTCSYKNHLRRFCINGKQFIEKDLLHNFVQVFGTKAINDMIHNISKIWIQRIYRF